MKFSKFSEETRKVSKISGPGIFEIFVSPKNVENFENLEVRRATLNFLNFRIVQRSNLFKLSKLSGRTRETQNISENKIRVRALFPKKNQTFQKLRTLSYLKSCNPVRGTRQAPLEYIFHI